LIAALLVTAALPRAAQETRAGIVPVVGMVIERSVAIAPGRYRLPAPADGPAIRVRGDGITVDLTGVTLEGGDPLADPDTYRGTGLLVEDSAGVTIRGGAVRGYKVGVLARRAPRLHLTGGDLSYNWKPRLWSGIEKESLLDWMSYHDNERDEWLERGAAIYLSESDEAEIDNTRAHQGQNGLMVTRSSRLTIWNNDFSFNSGIGIGLYRTTGSRVMHNRLDWNVRGYSHGFYYRGQDSAALLMYEQTSDNVVAYNSATHGGDGLFLWAGQSTMDTGQGGANDNQFWHNDFSHAVANGIEATFSRNGFYFNRIEDCWHGVWGGYSYDTLFLGNTFARNDEGMAIEHGQNITIHGNTFAGDKAAIRLWANPSQDPNWGYPKARDTRSRDYRIAANRFSNVGVAIDLIRTTGVTGGDNTYTGVATRLKTGADVGAVDLESTHVRIDPVARPEPMPGARDAMLPDGAIRGRETIIVDEWGPFDYRSPKVWPAGKATDRPLALRVLGPPGRWTLSSIRGARTDARAGAVPGTLTIEPTGDGADVVLALEYIGGEVVTPRGMRYPAGATVPFNYTLFEPAIDWDVRWWTFDAASDPLSAPDAFAARLRETPAKTETLRRFDLVGSGSLSAGLPRDRVAMRAEGTVELPAGDYRLDVVSDDGIRVWVDDELVIDRWTIHGSELDQVAIAAGRHRLRLEYFEATGWSELEVIVRRLSAPGTPHPGPGAHGPAPRAQRPAPGARSPA
jgi:hypothetical protein